VSFDATIDELREENVRLARELSEWQDRATAELEHRHSAEEQVGQLKGANEKLQRQAPNSAMTADYFNPRLGTILHIVEELKRGCLLKTPRPRAFPRIG
jgi:hypothetical protein